MTKPLSQLLEAIEPQLHDCCDQTGRHILTAADYNDYQRLKRVAIELAKAIEWVETKYILSIPMRDRINRAKDIIGGADK